MDYTRYWLERGKSYFWEKRLQDQYYKDQEQLFASTVKALEPKSVVEFGCGYGRVTRAMAQAMPRTGFLGLDLSPDQVRNAGVYCVGLNNVKFVEADILSNYLFLAAFDVVVCAEVLLHLPGQDVAKVLQLALGSAKALVHESWKREQVTAEHCHWHDYAKAYDTLGLKYEVVREGEHELYVVRGEI
jgi:SAM-dependent methyltransferase